MIHINNESYNKRKMKAFIQEALKSLNLVRQLFFSFASFPI